MLRRLHATRAFSLLEVMFAVALFGTVVTFILSAQAGLVAGDRTAAHMSQAAILARCRMTEIEEKELKLGFPEIEENDSSNICCDDREVEGFSCDWQVERVKLPEVTALGGDGGAGSLLGGSLGLSSESAPLGSGLPSSLTNSVGSVLINPAGGAQLDLDAGLQSIGQSLQQSFGGAGAQGLLSMVFSIVYPSLKPLLEAAIRRVTVVIKWKDSSIERTFTLTQYLTNPSRAGLLAGMMEAGAFGDGGGVPGLGASPFGALLGAPGGGAAPGLGGH